MVVYIVFCYVFLGFVDVFDVDYFYIVDDVVFGIEVYYFLGFGYVVDC